MNTVFFDESLALLVDALLATLGREFLLNDTVVRGVALRDASGILCFISESAACEPELRQKAENAAKVAQGRYACADRALLFSDDPGAKYLLQDEDRLLMSVGPEGKFKCWVVDRRIVGSGWMVKPVSIVSKPPRVVFASLKGGVGRSTALAVTAFDLASRGRNVLVFPF